MNELNPVKGLYIGLMIQLVVLFGMLYEFFLGRLEVQFVFFMLLMIAANALLIARMTKEISAK